MTSRWNAYFTAARTGGTEEPAMAAALRAAAAAAAPCAGDPQYYCPGDAARHAAPAGYYTAMDNGGGAGR